MPQTITIPGGSIQLRYDLQKREIERIVSYQQTTYETLRRHDALGRQRVVTYQQDGGALNEQRLNYDPAGPLLSTAIQEDESSPLRLITRITMTAHGKHSISPRE